MQKHADSKHLRLKNREISVCQCGSSASEIVTSTAHNSPCKSQITQSAKNVLASFEMKRIKSLREVTSITTFTVQHLLFRQ